MGSLSAAKGRAAVSGAVARGVPVRGGRGVAPRGGLRRAAGAHSVAAASAAAAAFMS